MAILQNLKIEEKEAVGVYMAWAVYSEKYVYPRFHFYTYSVLGSNKITISGKYVYHGLYEIDPEVYKRKKIDWVAKHD